MISIEFNREEIINLIERYYLKEEARKVRVSIESQKERVWRYEDECCVTTVYVKEEFDILGLKKEIVTTLNCDELEEIFNILLVDEGYKVFLLEYDDGLSSEYYGFGTDEYQVRNPYFNGIILTLDSVRNNPKVRARK